MNLVRRTVEEAAIGVAVADRPGDLNAFLKPGCAAAIWRRQPPQGFQPWVENLAPENLPCGRLVLPVENISDEITQLCENASTPETKERAWLIEDVTNLCSLHARLVNTQYVRLRMDVVATNACRKFHIDAVSSRMVCTYRGTGTQYGVSTDGADPRRVFTVPTGAPILLRGTLWTNGPPSGLLHRSPPIEGTGETRLVMVIDPLEGPE